MGKLERVLKLIEEGRSITDISRDFNIPLSEVEGMIKILESMGYLQLIETGDSACERCPLKSICPGSCIRFKGRIYQFRANKARK
ncbi:DNA-binding protein [Thermococcus sp.]